MIHLRKSKAIADKKSTKPKSKEVEMRSLIPSHIKCKINLEVSTNSKLKAKLRTIILTNKPKVASVKVYNDDVPTTSYYVMNDGVLMVKIGRAHV